VWDGGTARQIGLIDGFGGIDEAVAKAAALAKLGDDRSVHFLEAPRSYQDELLQALASRDNEDQAPTDALALLAGQPQARFASALADVRSILGGPTVQARCLECSSALPAPRATNRDFGLLDLIRAWLN
jgi:protease-4